MPEKKRETWLHGEPYFAFLNAHNQILFEICTKSWKNQNLTKGILWLSAQDDIWSYVK